MPSLILLAVLTLAARYDLKRRRIPNILSLGSAGAALLYLGINGHTWLGQPAWHGLLAALLALLLTVPGWVTGRLGGGDVKLLTALALCSDSRVLLLSLAGAFALLLLWALLAPRFWPRLPAAVRRQAVQLAPRRGRPLPLAPFLLLGTAIALG